MKQGDAIGNVHPFVFVCVSVMQCADVVNRLLILFCIHFFLIFYSHFQFSREKLIKKMLLVSKLQEKYQNIIVLFETGCFFPVQSHSTVSTYYLEST